MVQDVLVEAQLALARLNKAGFFATNYRGGGFKWPRAPLFRIFNFWNFMLQRVARQMLLDDLANFNHARPGFNVSGVSDVSDVSDGSINSIGDAGDIHDSPRNSVLIGFDLSKISPTDEGDRHKIVGITRALMVMMLNDVPQIRSYFPGGSHEAYQKYLELLSQHFPDGSSKLREHFARHMMDHNVSYGSRWERNKISELKLSIEAGYLLEKIGFDIYSDVSVEKQVWPNKSIGASGNVPDALKSTVFMGFDLSKLFPVNERDEPKIDAITNDLMEIMLNDVVNAESNFPGEKDEGYQIFMELLRQHHPGGSKFLMRKLIYSMVGMNASSKWEGNEIKRMGFSKPALDLLTQIGFKVESDASIEKQVWSNPI